MRGDNIGKVLLQYYKARGLPLTATSSGFLLILSVRIISGWNP